MSYLLHAQHLVAAATLLVASVYSDQPKGLVFAVLFVGWCILIATSMGITI